MVVAETMAQALDAAELVEVDYEPLPAVTTATAAPARRTRRSSPTRCRAISAWTGTPATPRAPRRRSPRPRTSSRWRSTIIASSPTRWSRAAAVGTFDPATRPLHAARLQPEHPHQPQPRRPRARRRAQGRALHRARRRRRLRRQELHLCRAHPGRVGARRVGRPVKWIASRSEVFLADHPARDMQAEASLALDADGRFLALKVASVANVGAYLAGVGGGVPTYQYVHLQGTVYRLPSIALHVVVVLSNTTPIGVMRGPGFAETVNILERLIDAAALSSASTAPSCAAATWCRPTPMPMTNAFGFTVDSGAFPETIDKALERADVAGFAARRRRERGARAAARPGLRLSHQGHRRLAGGECRHPLRDRRHGVADHRHAAYRPGPRDDLPADPRHIGSACPTSRSGSARATPT